MTTPAQKVAAGIFLLFVAINIFGGLFEIYGSVRVIAAPLALQLGVTYGVFSGVVVGALTYYLFKRVPSLPNGPRLLAWALKWPSTWGLFMGFLLGGFGFFFMAHTAASLYSEAFGARASKILTVSQSIWTGRHLRGRCYEHYFVDVPRLSTGGRLLCIDKPLPVGTRVELSGLESSLGWTITGAKIASDS